MDEQIIRFEAEPIKALAISSKTFGLEDIQDAVIIEDEHNDIPAFIESNTQSITWKELTEGCIIPTYSDSTLTISFQAYIESVMRAIKRVYPNEEFGPIQMRVSHPQNGRIPSALHKKKEDLLPHEKTLYYQRLAWICEITSKSRLMNGRMVHLTIGGCRTYQNERLWAPKKGPECIGKIFIAYKVRLCSNMMLHCDGVQQKIEAMNEFDIEQQALSLFQSFDPEANFHILESLEQTVITTDQFTHLLGRLRLYEALPSAAKKDLPQILLGDSCINAATRGFVENKEFGEKGRGYITAYELMQLLNESAKSSYIDVWAGRNQNATDIAIGVAQTINGESDKFAWFLK